MDQNDNVISNENQENNVAVTETQENNVTATENKSDEGFSWGKALLGVAAVAGAVVAGVAVSNHIEKKKKEQEPGLLGLVVGGVATGVGALVDNAGKFIDSANAAASDARQLNNQDLVNQSLYGSGLMKKAAAEVEFRRRAGLPLD